MSAEQGEGVTPPYLAKGQPMKSIYDLKPIPQTLTQSDAVRFLARHPWCIYGPNSSNYFTSKEMAELTLSQRPGWVRGWVEPTSHPSVH